MVLKVFVFYFSSFPFLIKSVFFGWTVVTSDWLKLIYFNVSTDLLILDSFSSVNVIELIILAFLTTFSLLSLCGLYYLFTVCLRSKCF